MSDLPPPPPPNMSPPPGYVAYGGYGAVQGTFQRTAGLAKWLVVLLGISLAVSAISLVLQLTLRNKAVDYLNDVITANDFDDNLALYGSVVLLTGAIAIAQLVVLCIWTFRLAKNHQVLGRQPQSFSPGATIAVNILGGCTLGILNFFMWREMWKASDPETAPGDPSWKQRAVTPLLAIYLATTLGAIIVGFTVGVAGGFGSFQTGGNNTELAERLDEKISLVLASGLLSLVAAAAFLMFVRQLSARHTRASRETA